MSVLMRTGRAEPNTVRFVMSLVICWQAVTAGWLASSDHSVINTDQCTCLSSNTISFNTQRSSLCCVSCLIPTNRKLKCSLRAIILASPNLGGSLRDFCQQPSWKNPFKTGQKKVLLPSNQVSTFLLFVMKTSIWIKYAHVRLYEPFAQDSSKKTLFHLEKCEHFIISKVHHE